MWCSLPYVLPGTMNKLSTVERLSERTLSLAADGSTYGRLDKTTFEFSHTLFYIFRLHNLILIFNWRATSFLVFLHYYVLPSINKDFIYSVRHISISSQLQLRTLFLLPEDVR